MLRSLQIRNYVLIDSLEVSFPGGLVIITGQTGAGKSILLGAISLLTGSKADQSVIGESGDNCVVEAEFLVPQTDETLNALLEENDIEPEGEDRSLTVRRVVTKSGRSRSFVNDSPIPVQLLQQIGSRLVDIHSQHQTLLLVDKAFQLSVLDRYAGDEDLLARCAEKFAELKATEKELDAVAARIARMAEEKDYNEARYKRLEEANLRLGELEDLESEQKQLANAEEIKESLSAVEELSSPADPGADRLPLTSVLKEMRNRLERAGKFNPELTSLAERIDSVRTELDDILSEAMAVNSRTELSQERLEAVEDRMSCLYDLMKKYSAGSVAELIDQRDALARTLSESSSAEDRRIELQKQAEGLRKDIQGICSALHEARVKASGPLAESVMALLKSLEMERSVFEVAVEEAPLSASGADAVSFRFSASGGKPVDVAKCASGGEMSRLMLSLKAILSEYVSMPTLIFDEIDTGVSGSTADRVGQMICSMGRNMQVFAITHLPQVAAKGNAHYLVEKEYDVLGSKATTSVRAIDGEDRVMELARMLSGSRVTAAAIENARSLLA